MPMSWISRSVDLVRMSADISMTSAQIKYGGLVTAAKRSPPIMHSWRMHLPDYSLRRRSWRPLLHPLMSIRTRQKYFACSHVLFSDSGITRGWRSRSDPEMLKCLPLRSLRLHKVLVSTGKSHNQIFILENWVVRASPRGHLALTSRPRKLQPV